MDRHRVTDVLREAGLVDVSHFTQEARDRGTAVHLATELHDRGELDETKPWGDEKAHGRLAAYKRFLRECNVKILAIEVEVLHPVLFYVGHLDRLVEINGLRGIMDIKPPGKSKWHGVQLAAYQAAAEGGARAWPHRWNLYLGDDDYRLHPWNKPEHAIHWSVFRAALTITQFKEQK